MISTIDAPAARFHDERLLVTIMSKTVCALGKRLRGRPRRRRD
jgi:hypothetical protein